MILYAMLVACVIAIASVGFAWSRAFGRRRSQTPFVDWYTREDLNDPR